MFMYVTIYLNNELMHSFGALFIITRARAYAVGVG